jgi:N-acyl-D-aspartate/D-glutamate deacylase
MICDGSGTPPVAGDLLVEGDRIAAIGPGLSVPEALVIHAQDRVLSPGFVDSHRHCDVAVFTSPCFGELELAQGITTAVMGNCGMAPVPCNPRWRNEVYAYIAPVVGVIPEGPPFENYLAYVQGLSELELPLNRGFLAGAGAIKTAVKGFSKTAFNNREMNEALALVREAMDAGALGISFGIMYQPECYSSKEELIALGAAAGAYNGILCAHIRGEGDSLLDSVDEMIEVARNAEIPLNISHFKATGIKNWKSAIFRAIERIETARSKGQQVTADFYPYTGGSTTLLSLLPPTVLEDTVAETLAKLAGSRGKELVRREMYQNHPGWDNMALSIGWDRVIISSVSLPEHQDYCGRNMEEIAQEKGYTDPVELLADLAVSENGKVGIIVLSMSQEDVDEICRLPWTALISDALYGSGTNPHPRLYGAFPKMLREYVRERKILSLEQAIRKMSAMPAERLGIRERGRLMPGYFADILVFNPQDLTDQADYLHPTCRTSGMDLVLVNGTIVWQNNTLAARTGRLVFRSGSKR